MCRVKVILHKHCGLSYAREVCCQNATRRGYFAQVLHLCAVQLCEDHIPASGLCASVCRAETFTDTSNRHHSHIVIGAIRCLARATIDLHPKSAFLEKKIKGRGSPCGVSPAGSKQHRIAYVRMSVVVHVCPVSFDVIMPPEPVSIDVTIRTELAPS